MKRYWKLILTGVALVAVLIVAISWHNGGPRRALEAYKRELIAEGEKLSIGELTPILTADQIQSGRDFMAIPNPYPSLRHTASMMKMVGPGRAMVVWKESVVPEDKTITNVWPWEISELRSNEQNRLRMHAALSGNGICFNLSYSQGFGVLLPHLANLNAWSLLFTAYSEVALHERRTAEAWTNLQDAVSLTRQYHPEPIIVSHLVKYAMADLVLSAVWEFLQSDDVTEAQLAALQSNLQAMKVDESTEDMYSMEAALTSDAFESARKSFQTAQAGSSAPMSSPSSNPAELLKKLFEYPRYWSWKHKWSYEEELCSLEFRTALVKTCRRIRFTGAFMPALKQMNEEIRSVAGAHQNHAINFLDVDPTGEIYVKSMYQLARAEIGRQLAICAVALKRFKLLHGYYPNELKALVPEVLQQPPLDPMNSKLLGYRLLANGDYQLSSSGVNEEGNGGGPGLSHFYLTTSAKSWLYGTNIVWPRAASPEEVSIYLKNPDAFWTNNAMTSTNNSNRP